MSGFIDSHCHLDLPHFDSDRAEVVQRAIVSGVDLMVNPGVDLQSCRKILTLTRLHPHIIPAVGIHPNELNVGFRSDIEELRQILRSEKVAAIGEIGLDNHHKRVSAELQISGLMAQLDLADEFCLPVIIHSRDSLVQITPILVEWASRRVSRGSKPPFGVMHSFEGDLDAARHFIEIGFLVGLAGPVTYKNAAVKIEIAREIPLESLILETDSPYLTPVPFRGQRNEPSYLPLIGLRTAIIRGCKEEQIREATSRNAHALFLSE